MGRNVPAYDRSMSDDREVRLETTGGWQPNPSGGERILVALAAIALVGAVLIVAGNLLPKQEAARDPATTPRPTARATPRPTPFVPIELGVTSAASTEPSPQSTPFYGWIRANVDLPILSDNSEFGNPFGTLAAGAVAYVHEQEEDQPPDANGWLYIDDPGPSGWIATRADGADLVTRYAPAVFPFPGAIWSLEAGANGFLAMGTRASVGDQYTGTQLFASTDGVSWQAAIEPPTPACCWTTAAWGPAGWLLVGTPPETDAVTWIWTSPDGLRWGPAGIIGSPLRQSGFPVALEGSDLGYLLTTSFRSRGPGATTAWYSADGSSWIESQVGQPTYDQIRIAALPIGFYAWTDPTQTDSGDGYAAFSVDGLQWVPVAGGPDATSAQVVAIGSKLIAMESDPSTGTLRAWTGTVQGDELTWSNLQSGAAFIDAAFTSVVADGRQATAFGWDQATEQPLTWSSDGGSWTRDDLPDAFGGIAVVVAGGEQGVVAVGHHWNTRGDNPVLWHRATSLSQGARQWEAEPTPVVGVAPDPTAAECRAAPTDALDFINLDRPAFIACSGSRPITFRAWSARCGECIGSDPRYQPEWLATSSPNSLFLGPIKSDGWWTAALLAPELGPSTPDDLVNAWLELTGHFDDPAAQSCTWTPSPSESSYYTGSRPVVETCRQQFVVTAARVVDGP